MNSSSLDVVPLSLALPVYMPPEDVSIGQHVFQQFVYEHLVDSEVPIDELREINQELEIVENEPNEFIDENFAVAHQEVFRQNSPG
ncbi:hypothetical protein TNCT_60631 [Trichonephila clavata]|uniref:Uncharacterized protein n=1 Tax=Trichonephila clavata TaxID=2740835 RepID=A0A8X6IXV1_TRICU|nr:hypothetical protein TNCT_60631 [Trichonephila clavata]